MVNRRSNKRPKQNTRSNLDTKFEWHPGVGEDEAQYLRIRIPTSRYDVATIFKAEEYLNRIGISFDTGFDLRTGFRDWEFDWSLHNPVIKLHKKEKPNE
jgi:hypothetical protein